jgi:hypothetical protein
VEAAGHGAREERKAARAKVDVIAFKSNYPKLAVT